MSVFHPKSSDPSCQGLGNQSHQHQGKLVNGKSTVQLITHGTTDCQLPALLLQTVDGRRHIFGGIGEGFQRVMTQTKTKMSKVENLFLTGVLDWKSLGGLPGLVLTIADQGVKTIDVHSGSTQVAWACATWRHFIFRQNIQLLPNTLLDKVLDDTYFKVKCLAVNPIENDTSSKHIEEQKEVDALAKQLVGAMFPKAQAKPSSKGPAKLPKLIFKDKSASSYIVQFKPTRGKFNAQKANKLGIPNGAIRGQLVNHGTVTLDDGTVITSDQVIDPSINGPRMLVIDCPSEEYIDGVISQDWCQSLSPEAVSGSPPIKKQRTESPEPGYDGLKEKPSVIFHLLGKSVNPFDGVYYEWLSSLREKFGDSCLHFISHPDYAPDGIAFEGAALLNIKLRYLYPQNFNIMHTSDSEKKFPSDIEGVVPLYGGGVVSLEPTVAYDYSGARWRGKVDWETMDSMVLDPLKTQYSEAGLSLPEEPVSAPEIPEEHLRQVEVITLGTGSALPSKYRNVVSTLVRVAPGQPKSILFDCGEGTYGNLKRLYGPEKCRELLQEIRILYLSHLHADHHLGAISMIKGWLEHAPSDATLYVMGPWKYFEFLDEWSQLDTAVLKNRIKFVDNESFMYGKSFLRPPGQGNRSPISGISEAERSAITGVTSHFQSLKDDIGLTQIRTCKAKHCDLAYCVAFTFLLDNRAGTEFKVAYSGDTKPAYMFAYKVGTGADLLIHEATHENGLEEEAAKKNHSTIGQALDISKRMEAKYTILTHFSQRYPKLPDMENTGEAAEVKAAIAFDGMNMKLKDIPVQKERYEHLKLMFTEVEKEEQVEDVMDVEDSKKKKGSKK